MTNNLPTLLFAIWAILSISCTSNEVSKATAPAQPTATPIQLPIASDLDHTRNNVINEAVRFATTGCPGINERFSGPPTRILAALTESARASQLVNPEADFVHGPGGQGAIPVWVVAIEGQSMPIFDEDSSGNGSDTRSFIFVIDAFVPEFTGCLVRDAPISTMHEDFVYGSFEFEELLDTQ